MALQRATTDPVARSVTFWARAAIGAGHLHEVEAARNAVAQFDNTVEAARKGDRAYRAKSMETDRDEAHAWLAFAEGKHDEALSLLRSVAGKQDALGKGEVESPAREMLADMLLELGRQPEALSEYEKSLKTDANWFNGLYGAGRAAELTEQLEKAAGYYTQMLANCENHSQVPRPEISHARAFLAQSSSTSLN